MLVERFSKQPVIIAEAGINHNGSVERALQMITAAAAAGADIIKFQTFTADECASKYATKASYQKSSQGRNQYELLRQLELDFDSVKLLKQKAEEEGLMFLSTPDGTKSLQCLVDAGVNAIKTASGEVTNFPFLAAIAQTRLPVILSTGMSNLGEVQKAVDSLSQNGCKDINLLHCTSQYPALPEDCNLLAIRTLNQAFGLPTGLSDHSEGIEAAIAATCLGAVFIEKHFTLSRELPGPDQAASMEPDELASLIKAVRKTSFMLGTGTKKITNSEKEMARLVRRSLVAKYDTKKGNKITRDQLECKRPATGIAPELIDMVVGRTLNIDIVKDQPLTWEMLGKADQDEC